MEPLVLDRVRLDQLLEAACAVLAGDWVLLGGAVAALCFSPHRVTEDIDLVPLGGADSRRYELMDFALAQGLPLEAVNSAADFFLRREEGFVADLELLREGALGRIFRPSPTLFLVLKSTRMTESDLADCLAQVASARENRTRSTYNAFWRDCREQTTWTKRAHSKCMPGRGPGASASARTFAIPSENPRLRVVFFGIRALAVKGP